MRLSYGLLIGVMLSLLVALNVAFWDVPFWAVYFIGFVLGYLCLLLARVAQLVSPAEAAREYGAAPDLPGLLFGVPMHLLNGVFLLGTAAAMVWQGSWQALFLLVFIVPLYVVGTVLQACEGRAAPSPRPGPMLVGWGVPVVPPSGWAVLHLHAPSAGRRL